MGRDPKERRHRRTHRNIGSIQFAASEEFAGFLRDLEESLGLNGSGDNPGRLTPRS
jgi:hypothetical protein